MSESTESSDSILHRPHEDDVAEEMVRELGIAPSLVGHNPEMAELVEAIRQQTDEVAERAQDRVDRDNAAAEHWATPEEKD